MIRQASITYKGREITNSLLRRIAPPLAIATAAIIIPLGLVWLTFWLVVTLPLHGVLRAFSHKGFYNEGEYVVPTWAMLVTAAFIALVVAFAFAAPASASSVATPEQIAAGLFPASPCIGKTTQAFDLGVRQRGHYAESRINGSGYVLDCIIRVDPVWWAKASPQRRCIVLVHEAGHQAGLKHAASGIMAPHPIAYYPPCASPRDHVIHRLESNAPGATVHCGRRVGRSYICRTELLNGRTVRYRITGASITRL